jgi:hypothetical protein
MLRTRRQEPYLKLLTSKWVTFPMLLVLGFAGGFVCAGYGWAKSGYQFLPSEIIVKPPPPNATWCFPDRSFAGASNFRKELAVQMQKRHLRHYNGSIIQSSMDASVAKGNNSFSLHLLHLSPETFQIVSAATGGFTPYSNYTLVTESGCYYLYPIPKKRSNDYDSLIQKRWEQQGKP